ncbi:MAG TPA: helix-turn-helix domain-containing protein [Pseudonocardiaceae bacterium]|nr:helix-turn-helix domain-containing protein [Pseudonocardiaceae bacterium]
MPLDEPVPELRRITDARTMRALSHPVRIAIIEALTIDGPMTATEVGDYIGESPTTCSFHLRQLAKYGFVEEAGGGKGRARPWRMKSIGMSLEADGDPESEIAQQALGQLIRDRSLARYRQWLETRSSYPEEWRDASHDSEYGFYLTAEELKQLGAELSDMLLARYRDRITDPSLRPPGSVPVEMLVFAYPIRPNTPDQGEVD